MRVDAGPVARVFRLVDGRPRTVALAGAGRGVPAVGPEVTVTVDGRRWADTDLEPAGVEVAPGAGGLSWTLRAPGGAGGLRVRVVVEADREAGVVRKRAEVTGRGRLERVELEDWPAVAAAGFETTGEPVAYNVGPVGLGQPVFGPGLFAGIEHPVAENLVGPGGRGVTLGLPVAADLGPEPATVTAIAGAGGVEEFWDYLDTVRARPARLVTLSNNWYHLGDSGLMDDASVRAEVAGFDAVAARHDLELDFFCLDDGWEPAQEAGWDDGWEPAQEAGWDGAGGLWGRMSPARFPSGVESLGPRIGLWLSPFGGYATRRLARLAWAEAHGLEIHRSAGLLCAAGRRYRSHLAGALARWTRAGVGYWKLDGVRFDCDEAGHGHPVGPGARTAQVDRFVELVAGIRAVRPDAVVAFTIGSHPSPWWLSSVDFVWRGGLDDTAAEHPGSRLDRFDTYIDTCLQAYRRAAMPVSALAAFSIVESSAAAYRDARSGPDGWARHCWLAAGRGSLHHDLYVSPDSLSEAEWSVLAEALAWARSRERVLARSRMVLGDPAAGEVYGFVARRGGAGAGVATACLRNPSDVPRVLDDDWPSLLGFPAGVPLSVTARYGRAPSASGRLILGPFEVVVLEARSGHRPETGR
jgi:hypothetical protein